MNDNTLPKKVNSEVDKLISDIEDNKLPLDKQRKLISQMKNNQRLTVIEKLGFEVMEQIMCLFINNMDENQIAEYINENFKPEKKVNKRDVRFFLSQNSKFVDAMDKIEKSYTQKRADLVIDHNRLLVSNLKHLQDMIDKLSSTPTMDVEDVTKAAKSMTALINSSMVLMTKHKQFEGKLQPEIKTQTNINITQNVSAEHEKRIRDLPDNFEVPDSSIIDVELENENQEADSE